MADETLNRKNQPLDETTYDHKWGFTDTKFVVLPDRSVTMTGNRYALSGTVMPDLLSFGEEILGIQIDTREVKPELSPKPVPPAVENPAFLGALAESFSADQISQDPRTRLIHSHGQTTADEVYRVQYGALDRVADVVVYPKNQEDVVQLILLAEKHDVCLVPYGGGTSVSGSLKLPPHETRMIASVDTTRLDQILWIDKENFRAEVQAGIMGRHLEAQLAKQGFTCGHEPDSVELSTLGGWIATNASGMKKNRYGNIEDIVENVTLVTPRGVVEQIKPHARISMGIRPTQLAFGSEGMLGIITSAVIKIHKIPEVKKYGSLVFPTFKQGVDFLYALQRMGVLPASIRLLDNTQFRFGQALKPKPTSSEKLMSQVQRTFLERIKGFDVHQLAAATIVMEGSSEEVAYQEKQINALAKQFGGVVGGKTNGQRGYMLTYSIAYIRDFFADYYIVGETYETTVPWDKIMDVCRVVADRAAQLHQELGLPGKPYVSPRVTQLYHTGVCIYFTHGFSVKGIADPESAVRTIDHELRRAIMEHGGSISHHHGVGKIRAEFMPKMISADGATLLREMKQMIDPHNVFGAGNNIFGAREP